jgi:hypothetical protein
MNRTFPNPWTYFLLVFVVVGLCAAGSAQVSKGSISGTVQDPSGATVAGAEVKAISADTNQVVSTTSDSSGLFKLPLLPIGRYRVEVSRGGFRKSSIAGVEITPGVDTGLGILKLELGSVAETVDVTAATPLIETTQAQITNTFDQNDLASLPGVQENQGLDNLAVLLPGVSASRDNNFSNTNGMGFTVDGLRGRSNDQEIDGQYNNDNSVTGPAIFVGDSEFVSQYQVTTGNFGAEYGRNSGSVVNVSTKQGTNTWHGSVYGTESNSALTTLTNQQSNTVWGEGLTKPPRFNDEFTGGTIGGPWLKNKIFFFGGFDDEIISSKGVYANGNSTPTPLGITQLAGCFPGSTSVAALQTYGPYGVGGGNPTTIGTPTTGYFDGAPFNNTIDPVTGVVACGYQLAGVERTLPNGSHQYNWVSRLDVTGAKDNVYVRYIFQKLNFFNVDEGQGAEGYPINVPSLGQDLGLSWTHKISDRMLNEFRASVGRQNVQFGGNTIGTIPTQGSVSSALAETVFTDPSLLAYGPLTSFPQGRIVNAYQLQDNWSYVHGKHQFKAGFNYTLQKSPNVFLPNGNGEFVYSDWGSYAANTPIETLITLGNPKLDFIEHDSFFYFGDDWKITSHLTLNLGLTYSYYGQPATLFHNNDARQQSSGSPFWDPTLPTSVSEFPVIPAPKNSWGPSIGFAYAFGNGGWLLGDNKTVVRGGYRLSYDPPYYNIYLNIASSAPQVLAQTIAPGAPLPAVPTGPNVRSELAPSLTLGVQDPRNFSETSVAPNFQPDRVHSWSLGIQREIGTHVAAEVRYVGNHGQHLFQSINGNPYVGCGDPGCVNPITGGGEVPGLADGIADGVFNANLLPSGITPCPAANAVVSSAIGRENCNEGRVRERTNTGFSDYNGLQAELRTNNLFNQLTLRSNYTWSKTTDNVSEIFGTFAGANTVAFSQDPFNYTDTEHGISGLDFPQTWALSFNEAIPVFRSQQGVLGHVFGGWSIAGSYILQSGQPYNPTEAFLGEVSNYNATDQNFLASFNSGLDVSRPFVANLSAPANQIGIYGADVCDLGGGLNSSGQCTLTANALYDYTAFNSTGAINPTTTKQEHFIVNSSESQIINGTPYGNAGRNSLRDYWTNVANFQITKTSNWGERVRLVWHMSAVNVFNHANYASIDPFLEDAGLVGLGTGFANPTVQNSSPGNGTANRTLRFGLKISF